MKKTATFFIAAFLITSVLSLAQDAPKSPLPKFKQDSVSIWLSPSNQIHNIGFGEYGTEKERMNEVADVVEPILQKHGVKVYRNNPNETIRDYTRRANELNVDLYFAIHSNAFNGKASGSMAYCHKFGGEGEQYAKRLHEAIMKIYPGKDRGIQESYARYNGKPMWEPSASNMPACLIEIAFHDNETDSKWILDNIRAIGEVLAQATLEHLAAYHPDAVEK